ncbi:hypothetical protein [Alkalicoccus chagannorensis]|uniref:hypothetical protein n=1 Tax=Alkalicoccus chagannorensis TaxID=427072 RepID=UPI0003FF1215|nr:hypothetical protein [Alkalicoccus chagannorensis]
MDFLKRAYKHMLFTFFFSVITLAVIDRVGGAEIDWSENLAFSLFAAAFFSLKFVRLPSREAD